MVAWVLATLLALMTGHAVQVSSVGKGPCFGRDEHLLVYEDAFALDFKRVVKAVTRNTSAGRTTWLQIGANTLDAKANEYDPAMQLLSELTTWTKVFVEPIPPLYQALVKNAARFTNAVAINAAVSSSQDVAESVVPMYCASAAFTVPAMLPDRYNQICSFDPNHISKHVGNPDFLVFNVTAYTVTRLMEKHNIPPHTVSVLLIDTEGFDYQVLKQIPFHLMRPDVIVYEHGHLGNMLHEAKALLHSHCYATWEMADGDGLNTAAVYFGRHHHTALHTSSTSSNTSLPGRRSLATFLLT